MAIVRQELNIAAINTQLHGPRGGVARDMLRRGLRVQGSARHRAPADTGRLRGTIEMASVPRSVFGIETIGIVVGTNLAYARWVHDGTGIYGPRGTPIVPRGTFLVFKSKRTGKMMFTRSVKGQRGVPYLKEALAAARG